MSSDVEKKHRHRLMSDAKAMYSTLLQDTIEGRVTAQTVEDAWEATLAELVRHTDAFDTALFLAGHHMADKVLNHIQN